MNTYGNNIRLEIFGESHGSGVGIVIDGIPAGIHIDMDYINTFLSRRKSDGIMGTKRMEDDIPEIISGVYHGKTTGSPIAVLIRNKDRKSSHYSSEVIVPRPSHADYGAHIKYSGNADMRGGGHFSGRLTAPLVFAGALCSSILSKKNITIGSHILCVNDIWDKEFDKVNIDVNTIEKLKGVKIPLLDKSKEELIEKRILNAKNEGDSVGGIIEAVAIGLPVGIGSPFFNSLESSLSSILFSIPAIKGVEFGAGFEFVKMYGSKANDEYYYDNDIVKTSTNNNGGICGGISNGMPLILKCVIKPTPSIFKTQNSVNLKTKESEKLEITGRHDPCIALRVVPVIEAVMAISIYDLMLDKR